MQARHYYTRDLDNAMHFAFHARVNELMGEHTFAAAPLNAAKAAYAKAFVQEDEAYGTLRKDARTARLKALDTERRKYYMVLNTSLKAFAKLPDKRKAAQARAVLDAARVYRIRISDSYDRTSAKLTNLGQDLAEKYAATVGALGMTAYAEGMIRANDEFKRLFDERLNDRSARVSYAMRRARARVNAAYARLVALLNACALLEDGHGYDEVIQKLNGYIADSRLRTRRKSSPAAADAPTEGGDAPEAAVDSSPASPANEEAEQGASLSGREIIPEDGKTADSGGKTAPTAVNDMLRIAHEVSQNPDDKTLLKERDEKVKELSNSMKKDETGRETAQKGNRESGSGKPEDGDSGAKHEPPPRLTIKGY